MKKITIPLLTLAFTLNTHAASFDCTKAKTFVEKKICSNSEISMQDNYLSILYESLNLELMCPNYHPSFSEANQLTTSEKKWLRERNQCRDEACIKNAYAQRIKVLTDLRDKKLQMTLIDPRKNIAALNGKWVADCSTQIYNSTLDISKANKSGFDFTISTYKNGKSGEIGEPEDGNPKEKVKAVFYQKEAIFVDPHTDQDQVNYRGPCIILFEFAKDKTIKVTPNQQCDIYGGYGVSFYGDYVKDLKRQTLTLVELGMLDTAEEEKKFAAMVGSKYHDFLEQCGEGWDEESAEPKSRVNFDPKIRMRVSNACVIIKKGNYFYTGLLEQRPKTGAAYPYELVYAYYSNDPLYKKTVYPLFSKWNKIWNAGNDGGYKIMVKS